MKHDNDYSESTDLQKRYEADYKLQEGAWKRVSATDANLGQKAAAWVTTNLMKAKQFFGSVLPEHFSYSKRKNNLDNESMNYLKFCQFH